MFLTWGLRYAGTLANGRKVYSDLPVVGRSPEAVTFAGGAAAEMYALRSGTCPGKVVTVWRTGWRRHFQSSEF